MPIFVQASCRYSSPGAGGYSAQCLSLKSVGANYTYLGNTAASNISVMKACKLRVSKSSS